MNQTFIVANHEIAQTIGKKSFWISTLVIPVIIFIMSFLSNQSTHQVQKSTPTPKNMQEVMGTTSKPLTAMILIGLYVFILSLSIGPVFLSFSQEKENRVMEIILSHIKPSNFVAGKLIAHIISILIQLFIIASSVILIFILRYNIPLSFFTTLPLNVLESLKTVFLLGCSFMLATNLALGLAAAMPTMREGQNFLSYAMMLGFLPLFFLNGIINDPNGFISLFLTYFPLTAGVIILVRDLMGQISTPEFILSTGLLVLYVFLSFKIAFKLFKMGAIEYQRKISLKEAFEAK